MTRSRVRGVTRRSWSCLLVAALAVAPARTQRPEPRPIAPTTHRVGIAVTDTDGRALPGVQVWFARTWHRPDQLRADATLPRGVTGVHGLCELEAPAGKWLVHLVHDHYVTGSGPDDPEPVVRLPAQRKVALLMHEIRVTAYQLADRPGLVFATSGGSLGDLRRNLAPLTNSRLAEVERDLELRFPRTEVGAYFRSGPDDDPAELKARALWSMCAPVEVPLQPVPLAGFAAPQPIAPDDTAFSDAFGTLGLLVDDPDGRRVDGLVVEARGDPKGPLAFPELMRSGFFWPKVTSGGVNTLPSGHYRLGSSTHPFVVPQLEAAGRVEILAGQHTDVRVRLATPVRRVRLRLQPPAGQLLTAGLARVRARTGGTHVPFLFHAPAQPLELVLPHGDYDYELGLRLQPAGGAGAIGTFTVVPGDGDQVVEIAVHIEAG